MGLKRRIGNLSAILLDDYIRRQQLTHQSELVKQRQIELAKQNEAHENLTAENRRNQETFMAALKDPELARRLRDAGQSDFGALAPTHQQDMGTFMGDINKAKTPSEMPEIGTLLAQARAKTQGDISPLVTQHQMRREQLGAEMAPEKVDRYNPATGAKETAFLPGDPRQLTGQVVQTEPTTEQAIEEGNQLSKGLFDEKFRQESKLENMKAAVWLENQKKLLTARLAAEGNAGMAKQINEQVTAAQQGLMELNQIEALATEVNAGFQEGSIDTYAGVKSALEQLPYVGPSLGKGMATASAWADEQLVGDVRPGHAAKVNQLEGMRYQFALKAIRAAGDPRPSNQDILGVLPTVPGAYESATATKKKIEHFRNVMTLLPDVAMANPGVTGIALLQLVDAEAKKRAQSNTARPERPGTGQATAAPGTPPPTQVTPAQKVLDRLRMRRGGR